MGGVLTTDNGVVAENILLNCNILYFHFIWGLVTIVVGICAIIARLPVEIIREKILPWHGTIGQCWMYMTIVQMATSLYCRGDGFRSFIFGFLVILVLNMIIAHASIRAYQKGVQAAKLEEAYAGKGGEGIELAQSHGGDGPSGLPDLSGRRVAGISLPCLKTIHGVTMCLSFSMLFGAGVMFTTRSKSLGKCRPMYAVRDCLDTLPTVIWVEDGNRIMGGLNCAQWEEMNKTVSLEL